MPLTDGRRLKYRLNGDFFFLTLRFDDLSEPVSGVLLRVSELLAAVGTGALLAVCSTCQVQ